MKISKRIVCWSLFFFLTTSCSLHAQVKSPRDIQRSCRTFVQGFYDWYVRRTLKAEARHESGGFDLAIKYRKYAFSRELFRLLKEDSDAQAKNAEGDIVGLDFDPFFNAQDFGERYVVGKITRKGDRFWVDVYGIWSGKKSEKPDVVPEVMFKRGRWLFVNFRYGNGDLLSTLKELREERQKRPR